MGKNRVRPKAGKPARWGRGQSSTSNPTNDKHRSKAKSIYHQSLTADDSGILSHALSKLPISLINPPPPQKRIVKGRVHFF